MSKRKRIVLLLSVLLLISFLVNISLGSVFIPFPKIISLLFGNDIANKGWEIIILEYRLPKAITALCVGCCLALSGLLMQTFFRNPMAGPFVLGINSGASLGVCLLLMGASWLPFGINDMSVIIAASLGGFSVLLIIIGISEYLKDSSSVLIVGLMLGAISGTVIGILSYFTKAENLQSYVFWSLGNLSNLSYSQVFFLLLITVLGILVCTLQLKNLNALLLGEIHASTLGVNFRFLRLLILLVTGIMIGVCTAFTGPIAFVGIAVPHIARHIVKSVNIQIVLPATILIGGGLLLICDTIAQVPFSDLILPINSVNSAIGAPILIWLLLKRQRLIF